jgi:hypothetical protein
LSPAIHFAGVERRITDHAIQPGQRIVRRLAKSHQLQECILNDILRRSAPLPRIQDERRPMPIDQLAQLPGGHHREDDMDGRKFHTEREFS